MYSNENICIDDDNVFSLVMPTDRPLKILQLTDLHLGFGLISKKADTLAMNAVKVLVKKTSPDLIVLTGDSIFPFIPKSGTRNNMKQAEKLVAFFDGLKIPYAYLFGNHDIEMGSKGNKEQIADIICGGNYSIFSKGDANIFGVGNYLIKVLNFKKELVSALVMLDSNMYGNGWFFSGFDCIHSDQIDWCMHNLSKLKEQNSKLKALAFFHMPLAEYKIAYEKMKLGDKTVTYNFGSIGEENDYLGISKNKCDFFEKALENGVIKAMFCGHDHYNTLSLTYKGIMLSYGMSIDYLGYRGIEKRYTQRGGTTITLNQDGSFCVAPVPLTRVVSGRVRGQKSYDNVTAGKG
ncbi:metallophosphoesterase [Lachnoclostridium sp.]|uniref:metallophosphoesterase n=1 Tax=Lachnoclostridium sp. TaxID=2028282 RepID=UPI0028A22A9A|nr:metallophosphoesterase [Lachnoclostridium sp.]